jgi:hypothetical protein
MLINLWSQLQKLFDWFLGVKIKLINIFLLLLLVPTNKQEQKQKQNEWWFSHDAHCGDDRDDDIYILPRNSN